MTRAPAGLDEIDFWDLDMFVSGDPHAAWTRLRREAPIWRHERAGGEPFWCITKYDDARAVHADPRLFSSERHGITPRSNAMLQNGYVGSGINPMIHVDPPRHAPLRKIISPRFTPMAIATLEEEIRSYAVECLDEAAQKRDIDFVADVAHRIPSAIAFSLLGVPTEKWDRLAELEHMTVTASDPEFTHGEDPMVAVAQAGAELIGYFTELVQHRMESPGDDLLSQFLAGRIDGEALPWPQVVAEAGLLLAGGLDTTRAAASAGGMLPLLSHPDQLKVLQADLSLVPSAVEEFVRWASPVVSEARTVTAAVDFGGHHFAENDRVVIWVPSCNRDEDHFEDPFAYDVRRSPNRHLGFAYGEHFCLGAHLARLTLKVEFEELLRRFRSFELAGEPARVRSNFVGGLKHLPMTVVPK